MPPAGRKHHGIGPIASVQIRHLHPRRVVEAMYQNVGYQDRLDGCIELEQREMRVNRVAQVCIVLRHELFENTQLHAVKRWVKITEEGPEQAHFNADDGGPPDEDGFSQDGTAVFAFPRGRRRVGPMAPVIVA